MEPTRAPDENLPETRIGGRPLMPSAQAWPLCKQCQGPMQFIAQIRLRDAGLPDGLLLLFQCQNDPGMCDEWDPHAGGNKAMVVGVEELVLATPPNEGNSLSEMHGVKLKATDQDYFEAIKTCKHAMGQLGGEPAYIQSDETPRCPKCNQPMTCVAQLEEVGDMNFGGGGCAYAYVCVTDREGAFLWQCS